MALQVVQNELKKSWGMSERENKMVIPLWSLDRTFYNSILSSVRVIAGAEKICYSESEFHHWLTKLEPLLPGSSLVIMPFAISIGHPIALRASDSILKWSLILETNHKTMQLQEAEAIERAHYHPHSLPQCPNWNIVIMVGSSPAHLGLSLPTRSNLPAKTLIFLYTTCTASLNMAHRCDEGQPHLTTQERCGVEGWEQK